MLRSRAVEVPATPVACLALLIVPCSALLLPEDALGFVAVVLLLWCQAPVRAMVAPSAADSALGFVAVVLLLCCMHNCQAGTQCCPQRKQR